MATLFPTLAELSLQNILLIIAVIGIVGLGIVYFGVRYWLSVTRPVGIKDVTTPTIDRLNESALEHFAHDSAEELDAMEKKIQTETAPPDLLDVVPPEEPDPKNPPAASR